MWQLFIDFKKAYDSIHRESLYNIMYEFGFPKKLIALTKMCMENTKYRVRTQNVTSGTFTVEIGLKQVDAQSPVLFNLALEKVVKILQDNEGGLLTGQNKIRLLGFADHLDIIGDSLLEEAAKKIGLEINTEKTKILELIESRKDPNEMEDLIYEKVSDFKYLEATLSTKNDWAKEISIRINKAQKAFYALTKFLTSEMMSRKTKVRLYVAIIRPTLTYGCKAWTTTKQTEGNLRTLENKV